MRAEANILLTILKYRRILMGELVNLTRYSPDVISNVINSNLDIIKISGEEVLVLNPLILAVKLLNIGMSLRKLSELLDWRDFEVFSTQVLRESGYDVVHGVRITNPTRFEIDVIGVEPLSGFGVVIDCKHWSSLSRSRLVNASIRHTERVEKLIKYYPYVRLRYKILDKIRSIVPVIVTLITPSIRAYNNVLVISIKELPHFLVERHAVLDYFEIKPIKIKQ